jgi:hypothetical protein
MENWPLPWSPREGLPETLTVDALNCEQLVKLRVGERPHRDEQPAERTAIHY